MNNDSQEAKKESHIKSFLLPVLMFLFVAAITIAIVCLYRKSPETFSQLEHYGYFGAFVISLLFNATVVLPAGNVFVLAALGSVLRYPLLVGVAAGVGAAVGELSGYMAGYSGRNLFAGSKLYDRVENWIRRWGSLAIFILSAAPLFFDVAGLAAGVTRFPLKKFILYCWLGRTLFYIFVAFAGAYGWDALLRWLG